MSKTVESDQGRTVHNDVADLDHSLQTDELRLVYGASKRDIRAAATFLESAIKEFDELGHFREETKTPMKRAFGEDFFHRLEDWTPAMSLTAMQVAEHVARHDETFGPGTTEIDSRLPILPS